jgi:exodeoxyribonuclease VII small subunit
MSDDVQELSFEQAYGQLEAVVEHLEAGELVLEEAIALYERGMRLARHCNDTLDAAELQVRQLVLSDGDEAQDL